QKFLQHPAPRGAWVGAADFTRRGAGAHVRMDRAAGRGHLAQACERQRAARTSRGDGGVNDSLIPRVDVLGIGVSAINIAQALAVISGWIERRDPHYVCVTGVHGVMESQRSETLR